MAVDEEFCYTTSAASTPPVFNITKSKVEIFEDYETRETENGYYVIAEEVGDLQFEVFLSENIANEKKFCLKNGKILFYLKQGEIHDAVIQAMQYQLVGHFGRANVMIGAGTTLRLGGNVYYPDIQVFSPERIRTRNQTPCIVCEVAYSNQKLSALHGMVIQYLGGNNNILAFIGIKISYPTYPDQAFQAVAMLYERGPNYQIPVRVVSFGTAPMTNAVCDLIRSLTHPTVNVEGYGVTLDQPPDEMNQAQYHLGIPDDIFLRLQVDDTLERFGMHKPQYGFSLNLYDFSRSIRNVMWRMEGKPKPADSNLSTVMMVDHLVDHLLH